MHERADDEGIVKREWSELKKGTRWKCIRCMRCCRQSWSVNLTWWEYNRMVRDPRARDLEIDRVEVDPETGLSHPYFVIHGQCKLLDERSHSCTIYPDWLYTCATYPFLLMPDGSLLAHLECPGFGHGEIIDHDQMKEKIMKERVRAGMVVRSHKDPG
ncbi:MAG: YkgJ family cysteine cluster protein [Candidatus Thermoplasmatota archaeon]|nr:YkgJ family cysteine cluster protein [Candidatus Thermoplasmatota archaeon]